MVLSIVALECLSEAAQFMSTAKRADFQTILPALIKIFVQCRRCFSPEVMNDNTVFKLTLELWISHNSLT